MKFGIDISQIAYEGTGVSRFLYGLTEAILTFDRSHEWTFFYSSLRRSIPPVLRDKIHKQNHRLIEIKLPPTALNYLWNTVHRMKVERLTGALDCFITSDWTEPPSHLKKATVIHDLVYIKYPQTVHPLIRETHIKRMKWDKKESSIIFADSLSTKEDIVSELSIPEKKVIVNYPGVSIQTPDDVTISQTIKKYSIPENFILTVGKIEPRKNIKRLLESFHSLKYSHIELVVVGHQGWDEEIEEIKKKVSQNIHFLNYISDIELHALYKRCLCFVYPSLYEGFGYPVVEAMLHNVPVATSNTSSLKEIGKDAALLFNPLIQSEITASLKSLIDSESLRKSFAEKGFHKAQTYSWKSYYHNMINTLIHMIQ